MGGFVRGIVGVRVVELLAAGMGITMMSYLFVCGVFDSSAGGWA